MNNRQTDKQQINNNNNKHNNIIIKITLKNDNNNDSYSTLLMIPSIKYFKEHSIEIKIKGIQTICKREGLTGQELLDKGYNKIGIKLVLK